jgi:hypothetical protein
LKPITRGFDGVIKNSASKRRFIATCDSCKFFYSERGAEDEFCHNGNVTDYDMVYTEDRTYCGYWELGRMAK